MKIPFKNTFQIISSSSFSFLSRIFLIIFFLIYNSNVANMDASHPWQVGFQDPATPIMEGIIFFNGLLMTFMILIACLVGWLLYKSLTLFNESVHNNPVGFTHSTLLEVVWTIIPAAILMIISVPSYNLLYAMDEVIDPSLTIKVVGHQWYWSYECSDFEVAPHLQRVDSHRLNFARESLRSHVDALETVHNELEKGETQTKVAIAKDLLNLLDNEIVQQYPAEAADFLASRLELFNLMLTKSESAKECYGVLEEQSKENEFVKILDSARENLEATKLMPEQKEAVIKFFKTFKQYLRVTEEDKLQDLHESISKELFLNSGSLFSDKQGSDSSKSSGFDDSDDDGSIVSDLTEFDKSNSNWEWCELVSAKNKYDHDQRTLIRIGSDAFTSERLCNSAALLREEDDTPFPELVDNMTRDSKELRRFIPIANLSEDKLIDTQLIDHQLRLTRAEREGYSSKYALDTAIFASSLADREFKVALEELNNAKVYLHWSNIELAAAKVNKLTAEYLQADASLGVTDPLFIRSCWINQKGYYSWSHFLRLAAKKLSEDERLLFLKADEALNGANSLLEKAQRNLTAEEQIRSNAIADNAKAQFLAMEREVISAVEEFKRGKTILANAEADLKAFQDISNRAAIRLEKAEIAFNKVKSVADRAKARLNAVDSVYEIAQSKLTGTKTTSESVDVNSNFKEAQNNLSLVKEEFDKTLLDLENSKLELFVAEDRLKTVKANLNKTEEVFENTGILEIQTKFKGKPKPKEYYPNHLWEIHNEDYAFVKAQLKTDTAELEETKISVNLAESRLSRVGGKLLEAELNQSKALIEVLKAESNNSESLNNEINHVAGLELGIAEAIYIKAKNNFEADGSKISELVLRRAEKGLLEAKTKGVATNYLDSFLKNNFENLDSDKFISDYAELCVMNTTEELIDAEKDYEKASRLLEKAKSILEKVTFDLSKDYDNPYLETLRYLHKHTSLSLDNSLKQLEVTKAEFSPLDVKLKPGLLQSKSYKEVVLAKAELANIKWLAARVAKTLDIPLTEEAKPFNVQFSHLNVGDSLKENNAYVEGGDSSFDASGDKGPSKSKEEIKEILSKLDDIKFSQTSDGFKEKFTHIFSELLKTLDSSEYAKLEPLVNKVLGLMIAEEDDTNQELRRYLGYIRSEMAPFQEDEEVESINFDSYLIADDDLVIPEPGGTGKAGKVFRLLEVDNRLFVPTNTHIRLLVTSADVLHSWAVPSLGIKVDACPGRLNQVFLFVKREGVFYGQCSELCGVNHGFMPIVVQAVSQDEYLTWVGKRLCS